MKYILAATEDRARAEIVRTAFRRSFHVDEASTVRDSLDVFRKRRYEFIFIDLDLIGNRRRSDDDPLRMLKAAVPSAEIIVMTPPERIREVDAFMSWLRDNSIRHKGKLRIVLTGSIGIEPILRQAGMSATLNTFSPFDLPPWDSETAVGCLEALANQYGLRLQDAAGERMVEKLGCCIPHHVQTFFDKIYTECKFKHQTGVTADFVEEVYQRDMLGVRGHAELSHLEERLKMVLGAELYPLALELLTETAVVGWLTTETATYLCRQYQLENQTSDDALKEILGIFEHDGYLQKVGMEFRFVSNLLRDWWKAHFSFSYIPVSERRDQR